MLKCEVFFWPPGCLGAFSRLHPGSAEGSQRSWPGNRHCGSAWVMVLISYGSIWILYAKDSGFRLRSAGNCQTHSLCWLGFYPLMRKDFVTPRIRSKGKHVLSFSEQGPMSIYHQEFSPMLLIPSDTTYHMTRTHIAKFPKLQYLQPISES